MPRQQTKKKFSFLNQKKGKVPTPAPVDVQDQSNVTPPSYSGMESKYKKLEESAQALANDKKKNTKGSELEELVKQKAEVDNEYAESAKYTNLTTAQEEEKKKLDTQKGTTDTAVENAQRKVSRDVQARQKLEKYKGKMIIRVIKHASELKDEDDELKEEEKEKKNPAQDPAQDPAQVSDSGTEVSKETSKEAKKKRREEIKKQRAEKKKKHKKKDRLDKSFAGTEIGRTLVLHGGTIAGAISDGVTTFHDKFEDRKAIEKFSNYKWFDGFADAASMLSILSLIEAGASFAKACVEVHKRRVNDEVDKQEQFLDARMILGKLADLFSIFLSAMAPYTALVGPLGPALGIVDCVIQLLLGGISISSNVYHYFKTWREKRKLWKTIKKKREKYEKQGDTESARFYDMDKDTTVSLRKWRRRWTKADSKRKVLQSTIAGWENQGKSSTAKQTKGVSVETGISSRISDLRQRKHEGTLGEDEEKNYKRNMHAMEALQMMSQYRVFEKTQKKMGKAILADTEGIITNATNIVVNGLSFADATGAAGTILGWVESGYEMARFGGSYIYKGIRKLAGSEKKKEETRKQMGAYLFDKMVALGPTKQKWDGDFFDLNVEDYKIREYQGSLSELQKTREGLDLRVSTLLQAPTGKLMKEALGAAFSQDGGVEFGADAM